MKKLQSIFNVLVIAALGWLGKAHFAPPPDPLVTRAEQTIKTAFAGMAKLVNDELARQKDRLAKGVVLGPKGSTGQAEKLHEFAEWLREPTLQLNGVPHRRGAQLIEQAVNAVADYQRSRDGPAKTRLEAEGRLLLMLAHLDDLTAKINVMLREPEPR